MNDLIIHTPAGSYKYVGRDKEQLQFLIDGADTSDIYSDKPGIRVMDQTGESIQI